MVACGGAGSERRPSLHLFLFRNNATVLYSSLPPEAWFANTLGLLIVVLGWMVLWALSKPAWKHPELDSPEAQQVQRLYRGKIATAVG